NLHFGLCESCNLAPNSSDEFSQIMQRAIMPEARAILVVSEVESDHGLRSLGADSWRLEKAKIDYLNGEGYSIPDAKWSAVPEKSGISVPQPLPVPVDIDVDTPPIALNNPRPRYTEEARRSQDQGIVKAQVLVGDDGTVKKVKIISGLPDGLDEE